MNYEPHSVPSSTVIPHFTETCGLVSKGGTILATSSQVYELMTDLYQM
jgi:hypothetical protein